MVYCMTGLMIMFRVIVSGFFQVSFLRSVLHSVFLSFGDLITILFTKKKDISSQQNKTQMLFLTFYEVLLNIKYMHIIINITLINYNKNKYFIDKNIFYIT